jgi:hypothetical protein
MLTITWDNDALEVDVTVSEIYEFPSEVTDHPVETGTNVTDHVRPGNETCRFECIVSNTPIVVPRTHMNGVGGSVRAVQLSIGGNAQMLQFDGPFNRVRSVHEQILQLRRDATIINLFTGFQSVTGVVISSYNVERHPDTGDALSFTLECRKVRIVSTMTAPVPLRRRNQRRNNRGNQPPTQPAPELRSTLHRGAGAVIRALGGSSS